MSEKRESEVVFFDVGHTLLEPDPPVEVRYAETAARFGAQAPPAEIRERFTRLWLEGQLAREDELYRTDDIGTRDFWHDFVARVLQPWLHQIAEYERFFEQLYEDFTTRQAWQVVPDAHPTLEELRRRGLRLGVISNWDKRLPALLETLELDRFFEAIITSAEVGYEKPSPKIFARALEAVGLPASSAMHIGDSYEADVIGAQGAGVTPVLLDRFVEHEEKRCLRVRALAELPALIDEAAVDR